MPKPYSFDPVYENDLADEAAILAICAAEQGDERLIEHAITRDAMGAIIVDMAALVAALRKEA